ncbi:MAG: cupin domain-containing protein [Nitrososphaerota archaeon]
MRVIRRDSVKGEGRSGGLFVGDVEVATLISGETGSQEYLAALVSFSPGARTRLHTHDHEQILFVVKGHGYVGTESEEKEVGEGDIILIPAGERHWHGAAPDSEFAHLAIINSKTQTKY